MTQMVMATVSQKPGVAHATEPRGTLRRLVMGDTRNAENPQPFTVCQLTITRVVHDDEELEARATALRADGWTVQHQDVGEHIEQPHVDDQILIGLRRSLEMGVSPDELHARVTGLISVIAGDLADAADRPRAREVDHAA